MTNYARRYPKFWLIYFVLVVIVTVYGAVVSIIDVFGTNSATKLIGAIVGPLSVVPLWGYIRQRRINPRLLWMVLLLLFSAVCAFVIVATVWLALSHANLRPLLAPIALAITFGPHLVALWQYVFHSPHLWQDSPSLEVTSADGA